MERQVGLEKVVCQCPSQRESSEDRLWVPSGLELTQAAALLLQVPPPWQVSSPGGLSGVPPTPVASPYQQSLASAAPLTPGAWSRSPDPGVWGDGKKTLPISCWGFCIRRLENPTQPVRMDSTPPILCPSRCPDLPTSCFSPTPRPPPPPLRFSSWVLPNGPWSSGTLESCFLFNIG